MTYWLVMLLVTPVRQLGFESLKARYQVISTFAHAQSFDSCVYPALLDLGAHS